MSLLKTLSFSARSAAVGVVAAVLAYYFLPSGDQDHKMTLRMVDTVRTPRAQPAFNGPLSYGDSVRLAAPSVVNIYSAKSVQQDQAFEQPPFGKLFGSPPSLGPTSRLETSLGSGVIVSTEGYLLTNNHVIEGADEIQVMLNDGRTLEARLVGTDPDTDLAVLDLDAENLSPITLGQSEDLQVGDVVLAIGNPFGVGQAVTMGIISATGRDRLGLNTFEDFIQTDAAINPGNSGGALVNPYGELVGINTAIFSRSGGSQGIGFAIPVSLAKQVMTQIVQRGRVIRGWLGVTARDISQQAQKELKLSGQGVLITGIVRSGPAHRAGVRAGDLLTHIDDIPIPDSRTLLNTVAMVAPGNEVQIRGVREGARFKIATTIVQRPRSR